MVTVGVSGILWATLAIFAVLVAVPFADRGAELHPRRRLAVVIPAAVVALTVVGLIIYAALTPVVTHIEM